MAEKEQNYLSKIKLFEEIEELKKKVAEPENKINMLKAEKA